MLKYIMILFFPMLTAAAYAQNKYNYVQFNKLMELHGTPYVIATIDNVGKLYTTNSKYLLFINTQNGLSTQVDFPKDGYIRSIEQIRMDSLHINKVLVAANTVDLDDKKAIDWGHPIQIIMLSTDGREKVQLTEDRFFAKTWATNRQTGTIVVTGHYDTNNNGKYDKTDKSEILIYDLRTLKLVSKI